MSALTAAVAYWTAVALPSHLTRRVVHVRRTRSIAGGLMLGMAALLLLVNVPLALCSGQLEMLVFAGVGCAPFAAVGWWFLRGNFVVVDAGRETVRRGKETRRFADFDALVLCESVAVGQQYSPSGHASGLTARAYWSLLLASDAAESVEAPAPLWDAAAPGALLVAESPEYGRLRTLAEDLSSVMALPLRDDSSSG